MKTIRMKALQIEQPIGKFYCGVIDAKILREITYSDVRRLKDDESRELDDFIGIQRPLSDNRVKQIIKYVSGVDATFPNSIIISIDKDYADWDEKKSEFIISYKNEEQKSALAKVLDGQHRIAGFDGKNDSFFNDDDIETPFQLLVTIFVDVDISTQANIFATVNLAQTKVNRSLVYDLESLAIARSPEKTAHDIAVLLNRDDGPFHKRIKRLGVATPKVKNELLTQAAFVQNVLKLMTHDEKEDRNYYLAKSKGVKGDYELSKIEEEDFVKYPFRKSFIESKDSVIARNLHNYFSAVSDLWPRAWDKENKSSSLNKTIGFIALIRVLRDILQEIARYDGSDEERILSQEQFYEILDGGVLDENEFENLEPVSKSTKVLYDLIFGNLAIDI